MLFQTMIFGGPLGGVWERYRTWSEAAQGHAAMCARVQAALGVAGRHPCPPGHLCEVCLDAPAVAFVPAPWGGEMGVCAPCGGLEPAVPSEASGAVSDCPLCTQPPGPDEDAHVYLQHCADTGHPMRGLGPWRDSAPLIVRPGVSLRFSER